MSIHILLAGINGQALQPLAEALEDSEVYYASLPRTYACAVDKAATGEAAVILLDIAAEQHAAAALDTAARIRQNSSHIPVLYRVDTTQKALLNKIRRLHPYAIIDRHAPLPALKQAVAEAVAYVECMQARKSLESQGSLLIFDVARIPMCLVDKQGRFVSANQAYTMLCGYSEQELTGKHFSLILPENLRKYAASLQQEMMLNLSEEGEGTWHMLQKSGEERIVHISITRFADGNGEPYQLTTTTDITAEVQEKEKLKEMVQHKDTLLKEVNHLVKNNFNVISGLLFLQAEKTRNLPGVFQLFQDSINRLKTIALIHEHALQQSPGASVNMQHYLHDVCQHLQSAFGFSANATVVQQHVEAIALPVNKAIACGIFVGEALSLLVRQASDRERVAHIQLNASCSHTTVSLRIADTGSTVAEAFEPAAAALSMQLMEIMATQLNARLSIETEDKPSILLTFEA